MLFIKIYLTVVVVSFICSLLCKGIYEKYGRKWYKVAYIFSWIALIMGGIFLTVVVLYFIWHL